MKVYAVVQIDSKHGRENLMGKIFTSQDAACDYARNWVGVENFDVEITDSGEFIYFCKCGDVECLKYSVREFELITNAVFYQRIDTSLSSVTDD